MLENRVKPKPDFAALAMSGIQAGVNAGLKPIIVSPRSLSRTIVLTK